jgi:exodeoxyribonuclease VII large subunit
MQQDGEGDLHLAFEALKEKLKNQGLFEQNLKKKIPRMPKAIGIVTSPTGAAVRDMINILKRRYPVCKIIIYPSLVQGENAASEIASGIEYFNKNSIVDVIITGRGGGSLEDLWAFNNESLAMAIYKSKIPVISAVGHETDFTISDFVADLRAPTPSAAAELCTPDIVDIYNYLQKSKTDMMGYIKKNMDYQKNHILLLSKRGVLTNPQRMFSDKIMLVEHYNKRLVSSLTLEIKKKKESYISLISKLDALSPLSVLKRGYSITISSDEKVISSIDNIFVGDNINIIVSNGKINADIKHITKN